MIVWVMLLIIYWQCPSHITIISFLYLQYIFPLMRFRNGRFRHFFINATIDGLKLMLIIGSFVDGINAPSKFLIFKSQNMINKFHPYSGPNIKHKILIPFWIYCWELLLDHHVFSNTINVYLFIRIVRSFLDKTSYDSFLRMCTYIAR